MAEIVVHCPSCQQEYSIDPSTLGRQFKCVQCGQTFTATAPAGGAPPQFTAPPPPMSATPPFSPPSFAPSGSFSQTQSSMQSSMQPGLPPSYLGEPAPGSQPRSNAALSAMICGFLCWIWPVSIAALVLGIIGVGKTRNNQMRGGGMAVTGIVLGAIGLILDPILALCASIMIPAMAQARLAANGAMALANMQQIGTAITNYEGQNQGALPPDLETLITSQGLATNLFVYPGGSDTPATSASTLEAGGHLSYVYLPGGKTTLGDDERVVLFENGRGHMDIGPQGRARGLNVLFADGHAEFESKSTADQKIQATRDALRLQPAGN